MSNPYNLMFGREPNIAIKRPEIFNEIINDFESENPTSFTYIITGARGAGKTVLMNEIENYFAEKDNFITVDLNPHRNMLEDLAGQIIEKAKLKKLFLAPSLDISFHGISFNLSGKEPVTSLYTVLERMLNYLKKKKIQVLIGIDEITLNSNVREFIHDYQTLIRSNYMIYMIMTGLYENIMSLQNDKSLTFLYRSPKKCLMPLNLISIKNSYISTLKIDCKTATELANLTQGYAFGYQLLGYLYFKIGSINNELLENYDEELRINAYDKIYDSLSPTEESIINLIATTNTTKVSEIMKILNLNNRNFSMFRQRLINKGVIISKCYGQIELALPRFNVFIKSFLDF